MQIKMIEKLFSYGTLQLETVQIGTFGRKLTGSKDILSGYVLSEIQIKEVNAIEKSGTNIHPIVTYTGNPGDQVEGTIFEITPNELQQADEYEVDEYTRVMATFKSGKSAWVYVDADNSNISSPEGRRRQKTESPIEGANRAK